MYSQIYIIQRLLNIALPFFALILLVAIIFFIYKLFTTTDEVRAINMRRMTFSIVSIFLVVILWVVVTFLGSSTYLFNNFTHLFKASISNDLHANPNLGGGPLVVSLTAPDEVMRKMENCTYSIGWFGSSGNGLSVDWGDGKSEPNPNSNEGNNGKSCTEVVKKHIYTAPGKYTIKVTSWHPGPTDGAVIDWIGKTNVEVTVKDNITSSIEILSPSDGETYFYQSDPVITWKVIAGKKLSLVSELLDKNDNVIVSEKKDNIAFSGEGSTRFILRGRTYDNFLKNGDIETTTRVRLFDNNTIVAENRSKVFTLSARHVDSINEKLIISSVSSTSPFSVKASFSYFNAICVSSVLDWGDGSPLVENIKQVQKSCPLDDETKTFEHVYQKIGKYKIILKTNEFDFDDVKLVVPYYSKTIEVSDGGIIIPKDKTVPEVEVVIPVVVPSISIKYVYPDYLKLSYENLSESTAELISEKTGKVVHSIGVIKDMSGSQRVYLKSISALGKNLENGYYYVRTVSNSTLKQEVVRSDRFYFQPNINNPATFMYPLKDIIIKKGEPLKVDYKINQNELDGDPLSITISIVGDNSVIGGGYGEKAVIGEHSHEWIIDEVGIYRPYINVRFREISYTFPGALITVVGN